MLIQSAINIVVFYYVILLTLNAEFHYYLTEKSYIDLRFKYSQSLPFSPKKTHPEISPSLIFFSMLLIQAWVGGHGQYRRQ